MQRAAFIAGVASFASIPRAASAALDDDALFMQIANAAAARLATDPPVISYSVSGTVHAFHGENDFARTVTVRPGQTASVDFTQAATEGEGTAEGVETPRRTQQAPRPKQDSKNNSPPD